MIHANDDGRDTLPSEPGASEDVELACDALCRLLASEIRGPGHTEPRYVISVASRMVGVEAHRLRHYERLGFVRPGRSDGNTRLYSQDDVDHLCCVKTLVNDLGLNSAGVQFALVLMKRMEELQRELEGMSERLSRFERRRQSAQGPRSADQEA